jgi:hypothetical protein
MADASNCSSVRSIVSPYYDIYHFLISGSLCRSTISRHSTESGTDGQLRVCLAASDQVRVGATHNHLAVVDEVHAVCDGHDSLTVCEDNDALLLLEPALSIQEARGTEKLHKEIMSIASKQASKQREWYENQGMSNMDHDETEGVEKRSLFSHLSSRSVRQASLSVSRAAEGSSSTSTEGCLSRARARATRARCPPDRS